MLPTGPFLCRFADHLPLIPDVLRTPHRTPFLHCALPSLALPCSNLQVVFFDSDPHAHAPFYFLLARLGLARVVAGALQLEVRLAELSGWLCVTGCALQVLGCTFAHLRHMSKVDSGCTHASQHLQEGKDLHQLGLSKSKSTPQDWIRHAQTMVKCARWAAQTARMPPPDAAGLLCVGWIAIMPGCNPR